MKFPYLLGILSFALISQASGADITFDLPYKTVDADGGVFDFRVGISHTPIIENDEWSWSFDDRIGPWTEGSRTSRVTSSENSPQNGTQYFTYYVPPNIHGSERTQWIKVVKTGLLGNVSKRFYIRQLALEPELRVWRDDNFDRDGGAGIFSVSSNTSWEWWWEHGVPDWVITNESTNQSGDQTFTYSVLPNTTTSARRADIKMVITTPNFEGGIWFPRHTIYQAAGVGTLSLSSPSSSFGSRGSLGNRNFSVSSNTDWQWSSSADWVRSGEGTNQNGDQTFTYSVRPNPSASARTARITFTIQTGRLPFTRTHTISQSGAAASLSLSSSSSNFESSGSGGNRNFSVSSNASWEWSDNVAWLTINESPVQTGNQAFTYSVVPNISTISRTARITFTTTSGNNTVTRYHDITQSGAAPTLSLSAATGNFDANGSAGGFTASSNTTWRWSRNASWVTASEPTAQSGNQTFNYTVQPNTSTSSRSARITFTTTSGNNTVTRYHDITQGGAPDTMPPVITLVGPPTLTIEASREDEYTDQGATCLDEVDGNLSHAVEVSGQVVDLRNPGTYIIRYDCQDAAGNEATEVIRTVHVKDTLPPVITLVGPPTLTIEASREDEYTDQGATCLDEVDGNLSHAVEVSGQVVNLRNPGTYIIRYDCQDAAGNEATEVIRTVHVKDTLPPVITLSGNDPEYTEAGFAYEEPGANAEDALDGNVNVVIDHSGVDTGVLGNHSVTFSATDTAQNTATAGRTVKVRDTLPPVISLHLQDRAIHVGEHGQFGINGVINAPDGLPVEDERNPGDNVTPVPGPRGEGTIRETPFTQPDGTPVISRQKWVIRTGAGEEEPHLPIARVWDHGDTDLEISTTITLIDLDGNAEETVVSKVDFSRRSTYLFRYDARDSAGNHAEQVAFALIIDDQQAPVISLKGKEQTIIEAFRALALPGVLPGAKAVDNIDGDLSDNIRYQVDEVSKIKPLRLGEDLTHSQASSLIDTSAPSKYLVTLSVHDQAGIYGHNNSDNQATARRRIEVRDTLPPVITLTGNQTVFVEAGVPYQDAGASSSDRVDGNVEISIDGANIDTNIVGSNTITYTATDAAGNVAELTRTVNVILTQAPTITSLAGVGAPKALSAVSITFASYLNAGYVIERSRDLENWEVVSEVQGEAQSTTITIDEPILDGDGVYYRVGVQISQEE